MTRNTKQSEKSGGRHRFPKGNKFGRGNPMGKQTEALRVRLLEWLAERGVEELLQWLWDIAADVKGDPFARIAAIKELLNRSVGKPEESLNVRQEATAPLTLDVCVQKLRDSGIPETNWPPAVLEYAKNNPIEKTSVIEN